MTNLSPPAAGVARGRLRSRTSGAASAVDLGAAGAGSDDTLYALLVVIGAVVVIPMLVRGGVWGAEATLGAVLCVLAGRALLVSVLLRAQDRRRRDRKQNVDGRPIVR